MSRWVVALTVAALLVGGATGWLLHPDAPPPVAVSSHQQSSQALDVTQSSSLSTDANISIARVLPPTEGTKRTIRFRKPEPFVAGDGTCHCPEPAIASIEEVTSKAGAGSIVISSDQQTNAVASSKLSESQKQAAAAKVVPVPDTPTKWDVDGMVAAHPSEPTKVMGGGEITWRPTKHVHGGFGGMARGDEAVFFLKGGLSF